MNDEIDRPPTAQEKSDAAAALYQGWHREVIPAGTVGPIVGIVVPPPAIRPFSDRLPGQ